MRNMETRITISQRRPVATKCTLRHFVALQMLAIFLISCGGGTGSNSTTDLAVVSHGSTSANVFYVATTGSDLFGDGSANKPWKTINYGISRMAGGDTLLVKKGIYTGKGNFITGVPSGSSSRYTTIMAEAPMETRIQRAAMESLDYRDNLVFLGGQYVKVDGFIFDLTDSMYPPHIGSIEGSYNKITRCIFRRAGVEDNYGGLLVVFGSNNLVEDVAGVGACRYCFEQGSPTGITKYNIWRRVVGRFDYSGSDQPKRTITTYGNDSGTGVSNHLYQNVIALDGNDVDTGRVSGEVKYSAIGVGKTATNVIFVGSIVLNEEAYYAGIFASVWGAGNKVIDSIVWDLSGSSASVVGIRGDYNSTTVDRVTLGGSISGGFYTLAAAPTNSALGGTHANLLTNTPGATIVYRYGVSGTLWGEPGYDQLTSEPLWPWPYEDKIKAVFAEPNDPPNGYLPSVNNTKRGFAADGSGLYGGPISLTSYIWEYLGTPCPATVCK